MFEYTTLASAHISKLSDVFYALDEGVQQQILFESADRIEETLADREFLSAYTHEGQTAFLSDVENWNDHLLDQFSVMFDGSSFHISNSKYVQGANGRNYNLFQLLFEGFGPYEVPKKYRHLSFMRANMGEEAYAYARRTKAMSKKHIEAFQTVYFGNKMTYFYRYAGKMFYNTTKRGAMSTSLVHKFKKYIDDAIAAGIEKSLERHIGEEAYSLVKEETDEYSDND